MAGYEVVWANEFVPAAQESYKANAAPDCILDKRDIKLIHPSEILKTIGLAKGELDLFDGSPPCQAFSTAGKREKGWGQKKTYEHGASQCNETLFDEYIRLLRGLMPKVFVAENVSGLVKGTAKGYFLNILKELKESGYRVVCRVLDAQWLGVPQQRQRTIFVGVREDLKLDPVHPMPMPYRYSVRDALPWIDSVCVGKVDTVSASTVLASDGKRTSSSRDQGLGMVVSLPPSRLKARAYGVSEVDPAKPCPTVTIGSPWNDLAIPYKTREVMCQSGAFPKHYTSAPAPAVMAGRTVEMKSDTGKRKFTIAELKRICAFPDDFILTGSYTQQWERLGNSVPPVMMMHIASAIRDQILLRNQ